MTLGTLKIIAGLGTITFGFYFGFKNAWHVLVGGYLIGSGTYDLYLRLYNENISQQQQNKIRRIKAIIGIIVIIATAGIIFINQMGRKQEAARIHIESFQVALDSLRLDIGRYPTTAEGLRALVSNVAGVSNWLGPYLKETNIPNDPWNNPYHYKSLGEHGEYELYSFGADNKEGGNDENSDIVSW